MSFLRGFGKKKSSDKEEKKLPEEAKLIVPDQLKIYLVSSHDSKSIKEIKQFIGGSNQVDASGMVEMYNAKANLQHNDKTINLIFSSVTTPLLKMNMNMFKEKDIILFCPESKEDLENFYKRIVNIGNLDFAKLKVMIVPVSFGMLNTIIPYITNNTTVPMQLVLSSFAENNKKSFEILCRQYIDPLPTPNLEEFNSLAPVPATRGEVRAALQEVQGGVGLVKGGESKTPLVDIVLGYYASPTTAADHGIAGGIENLTPNTPMIPEPITGKLEPIEETLRNRRASEVHTQTPKEPGTQTGPKRK